MHAALSSKSGGCITALLMLTGSSCNDYCAALSRTHIAAKNTKPNRHPQVVEDKEAIKSAAELLA